MPFKGIFLALSAAFFFGLIPTSTKLSYNFNANTELAIILRYSLAVILITFPFFLIKNDFKKIRYHIFGLIIISIGSFCLTLGLLSSVIFIPVSLVALIFYTYPLFVLGYTFFLEKKINPIQILGFFVAFIGLGIALGPSFNSINLLGIMLAFLAAIGAATVLISNEYLAKDLHSITINAFTNLLVFLLFSIIILINFEISFPTSNQGWFFLILASLCYSIAFYLQLLAVKNIGSTQTSLLLYLEPIVIIITAIILLNETLSTMQFIGTIIVITALITTTYTSVKKNY